MDLDELKTFAEQGIPFNQFLGFTVTDLREGYARIEVTIKPQYIGDPYRPALHGGLTSALADTVGGIAAFTMLEPDQRVSTVDMRVDYLRPASVDWGRNDSANGKSGRRNGNEDSPGRTRPTHCPGQCRLQCTPS